MIDIPFKRTKWKFGGVGVASDTSWLRRIKKIRIPEITGRSRFGWVWEIDMYWSYNYCVWWMRERNACCIKFKKKVRKSDGKKQPEFRCKLEETKNPECKERESRTGKIEWLWDESDGRFGYYLCKWEEKKKSSYIQWTTWTTEKNSWFQQLISNGGRSWIAGGWSAKCSF